MRGMSLLELLVYLSGSMLLLSLSLYAIFILNTTSKFSMSSAERWVQLSIAMQRIIDDIHQTSATDWQVKSVHGAIFTLARSDCCWMIDKKRLVRITGKYDKSSREWSSRAVSVILDNVESLSLRYTYLANRLAGVNIRLVTDKNCALRAFVACKVDSVL